MKDHCDTGVVVVVFMKDYCETGILSLTSRSMQMTAIDRPLERFLGRSK